VLLAFFSSAVALSRWRRQGKERAASDIVDKHGPRDAAQVWANGGVFAACAALSIVAPAPAWTLAALGALTAAAADTWATEVGVAIGGAPRALFAFAPVPAGTSGAVSVAGTVAMLGGALFLGTVARLSGFDAETAIAAAIGGVCGALADTVAGATLQERRSCPACGRATEQRVHSCGTATVPAGGLRGMTNDAVNLVSTVTGAFVAVALAAVA
jgi:uncharacterized protein (TIGR00297 family)